jgi:hypothetical protein
MPWLMSVSEDLAWHHHRTRGALPLLLRPVLWYKRRLIRLVVADPEVFRVFLGVYHMVRSPAALLGPRTLAKALFRTPRSAGGGRAAPPPRQARRRRHAARGARATAQQATSRSE